MKGVGLQKSDAHRRDKEDKGDKEKESGKEKKKHASKEEKRAARAARKADKEGGASEQVGSSTDGSEAEDYVAPPVVSNKPHPRVVTDSSTVKQDHLPTSTATAHTDAVAAAQNGTAVRKGENGVASSYGTSSPSMMSPVESGSYRKPHSLNGAAAPLTSLKVGPRGWSAMLDGACCAWAY